MNIGEEQRMYDVVVMGSNTVDAFITTEAEIIRIDYPKSQHSGERDVILGYPLHDKVLASDCSFSVGGSGVNAATAFARTGLSTSYIGCIGKDHHGAQIYDHLKDNNISFHGSLGGQSGFSVILETQEDDRTILVHKGCNNDLRLQDVPLKKVQSRWFYSSTVLGETYETMKQLIADLQNDGVHTAVNMSPYMAKKGIEELEEVLRSTDVLIVNKEEAQLLTGKTEVPRMLDEISKYVIQHSIITDGKNGTHCMSHNTQYYVEPKNTSVVGTTGAGDAFNTGFIIALINDKTIGDALKAGMIQAESVIQHANATDGLLPKDELLRKTRNDKRKPKVIK